MCQVMTECCWHASFGWQGLHSAAALCGSNPTDNADLPHAFSSAAVFICHGLICIHLQVICRCVTILISCALSEAVSIPASHHIKCTQANRRNGINLNQLCQLQQVKICNHYIKSMHATRPFMRSIWLCVAAIAIQVSMMADQVMCCSR